MMDYSNYKVKNHIPAQARCRRFRRKLNLSWCMRGQDVWAAVVCAFLAGLFIGIGVLVLGWRP